MSWTPLGYDGPTARKLRYHPIGSLALEEKTVSARGAPLHRRSGSPRVARRYRPVTRRSGSPRGRERTARCQGVLEEGERRHGALIALLVTEDHGIHYERRWHVLNAVACGTSYPAWASETTALKVTRSIGAWVSFLHW